MTLSGQSVCGRDSKPRGTREALQRRSLDPKLPWPRAPANVQAEQRSAHSRHDQAERGPLRVPCETTANQRQTLKRRASQGKAMSKDTIHNPVGFFFFFWPHGLHALTFATWDGTCQKCEEVLTAGLPGTSPRFHLKQISQQ